QTGVLPYWEIAGNEGGSMIGYHSVPVIADAILKGIGNFDKELALKAMVDASNNDRKGLGHYLKYQFVPTDKEKSATVSKTLEYSYDDWCIAQVANHLGKDSIYTEYMKRSEYYKNVFDPEYKLMRGKNSDGTWYEPFHPRFGQYGNPHYVEANAWQYSFFVPHDMESLIEMMGGNKDFEMMMDSLFNQTSEILGEDTEDIVGRIGQYAHGNEPSHHVAYLYDYINKDKKTQFRVNQIIDSLYTDTPDGLCGNDDCGQMSAWYVFSAIGFYPVNPLDGRYYFGSPQFEKVELKLPSGKIFTVLANNVSNQNIYIKSKKLNGEILSRPYITYEELIKGGVLEFEMH
ncbi:MAG: glycoside hydrolase family 92 protein, partial [Candidatus Neomarinimicrobiota bacterium]